MVRSVRLMIVAAVAGLVVALLPAAPGFAPVVRATTEYNGIWGTSDYGGAAKYFGGWNNEVGTRGYTPNPPNTDVVLNAGLGDYLIIGNQNGTLDVGTYEGASVGSFAPGLPRLDVAEGQTMDCSAGTQVGRFVILEAPVITNNVVSQFAADFEIRCNGLSQLRGGVRVHSAIPFHDFNPYQTHDTVWPINVPSNGQYAQTITIANDTVGGDGPITIGVPTITGPDAAVFKLQSTTCVAGVLANGASCTVSVLFDPVAEGSAHAVVDVPTDRPLGDFLLDLSAFAGPAKTSNAPGGTTASPTTFYPYKDGYRDTTRISGYSDGLCTVRIDIRNSSNSLVRRFTVPNQVNFSWYTTWDGKNNSGSVVPAGTYKVTTVYTDLAGNVGTASASVTVSSKRLYTYSTTITRLADQYAAKGSGGTGRVSTSSAYSHGRKLSSGASGFAVLGYTFSIPSATVYSKFTLRVTGKSPNGRQGVIGIQNFGISSAWIVDAYDVVALAGPAYATWSVSTTNTSYHRSGRTVHGMVYVEPTSGGSSQVFDFSSVKLTVTYKLLK